MKPPLGGISSVSVCIAAGQIMNFGCPYDGAAGYDYSDEIAKFFVEHQK